MPILNSSFKPAWWLRNPHLQTLWPALIRRTSRPPVIRERLSTPDGDFVDADWCGDASNPIVILLHGLAGSSQAGYLIGMQRALLGRGFRSVALNFRGCSGEPNLSARSYNSGDTEDLRYLCCYIRQKYPQTPLAAVGFSLGGNVLLKWLGEEGRRLDLFAAVAVSVPLQLELCVGRMDQGFSRVYRNHLLRRLKQNLRDKREHLRGCGRVAEAQRLEGLGNLEGVWSFWEYDDRVVAPLYGFRGARDYYLKSSSRQFLRSIHTPTLVIHSVDDPFMTPAVIPTEEELSSDVYLEVTRAGGHVGFISGQTPARPSYWLEQRIPEFLAEHLPD